MEFRNSSFKIQIPFKFIHPAASEKGCVKGIGGIAVMSLENLMKSPSV